MPEIITSPASDPEAHSHEITEHTVSLNIKGLDYELSGVIPQTPAKFELVISLPASAQAPAHTRAVGRAQIKGGSSPDGAPTISLDLIRTQLNSLPENDPYYKAVGVGSALLDSLCAVADMRGWRITLFPDERDDRLKGEDLDNWYRRRGFKSSFDVADESEGFLYAQGEMLRFPSEPDLTQPVTQLVDPQTR